MSNYSNPSDSWRTTSFVTLAHSISKSDFSANKGLPFAMYSLVFHFPLTAPFHSSLNFLSQPTLWQLLRCPGY